MGGEDIVLYVVIYGVDCKEYHIPVHCTNFSRRSSDNYVVLAIASGTFTRLPTCDIHVTIKNPSPMCPPTSARHQSP
jgi:hypothetical protein